MGRRKKIVKARRFPRFFKYLTIFGATIGIVSSSAFAVCMAVDAAKGDLITDVVREYTASFSSEGSIISKATYKRGQEIPAPENPTHSIDGESNYFFIGWDTNHNGIPDVIPPRAYYSFDAEAVYFRTGKFDLNFLDLLNMDLEDLLELLQNLNIDWEQFMSMFNIDPETLMQWLMQNAVLSYETKPGTTDYPVYFRSTSFGDFDYGKKSFKAPDCYDPSLISDNSVNPLSFTSYKLKKLEEMGMLPDGFGFINYDITYATVEDYYPLPECEYSDDLNEYGNSDAHYVIEPVDNQFSTYSAYCPAFGYVIDMFDMIPLTGTVYRDEKKYYQYALEHYTSVPSEYNNVLDDMIIENDWYDEELWQVDSIAAYVSQLGACSMFNDEGDIDISGYVNTKNQNKDPVMGLLENGKGSDLDFNTVATLLFRRLNIPARLVKGYVGFGSTAGEPSTITLFNQHYWCEIYVKGTGWMICDCMDTSAITGTNPYAELDKSNTPLENKHILDRIKVKQPENTEYFVGDELNLADGGITAYFQDGQTSSLYFASPGVTVTGFDSSEVGPCKVTVSYTYEGVTKTDSFYVTIKSKSNKLILIEYDFDSTRKWYYDGEFADHTGIIAIGHYEDGTTTKDFSAVVETDYDAQPFEKNAPGTKTAKVTATVENSETATLPEENKTGSYNVTVYYRKVTSIEIFHEPDKTDYYAGDKFKDDGLVVYFHYYDGDYDIAERDTKGFGGYTYHLDEPTSSQMNVPDTYDVTLSYQNDRPGDGSVDASFQITVSTNNMTKLNVSGYKNTYYVGETFAVGTFLSNATASVSYEHTEDSDVDVSKLVVDTPPNLTETGSTTCILSYTNENNETVYSDPLVINVLTAGGPIKVTYNMENEAEFDYNGQPHYGSIVATAQRPSDMPSHLSIQVTMQCAGLPDNGTDIDEHTYVPVLKIIANGSQDVTDKYSYYVGEGSEGITYYVNPIPVSISLAPAKSSYKRNQEVQIVANGTGLASTDSVVFDGVVMYDSVGYDYQNYLAFGSVRIMHNGSVDVTNCYYVTGYTFTKVEITD